MYIVIGYHGLDDQCVVVWVEDMVCVSLTKSDVIRFPSELLGMPLVRRVCGHDQSFLCFSEIAVLGFLYLPRKIWPIEDSSDLARRSCLTLVVARLGASVGDTIS